MAARLDQSMLPARPSLPAGDAIFKGEAIKMHRSCCVICVLRRKVEGMPKNLKTSIDFSQGMCYTIDKIKVLQDLYLEAPRKREQAAHPAMRRQRWASPISTADESVGSAEVKYHSERGRDPWRAFPSSSQISRYRQSRRSQLSDVSVLTLRASRWAYEPLFNSAKLEMSCRSWAGLQLELFRAACRSLNICS